MTKKNHPPAMHETQLGFSLIEIAIVLVIVAVLISIVAVPLSTQVESQRTNETNKQLEQIKEAIYGFAMANGRLPCPVVATATSERGLEPVPMLDGACPTFNGYLPAATLGLAPTDEKGYAQDAWNLTGNAPNIALRNLNRIRYAVFAAPVLPATACNGIANPFTQPSTSGLRVATVDCLAGKTLLSVCSSAPSGAPGAATECKAGTALTTNAPFVIFSNGKNAASNAANGTIGLDESHNADADAYFVSHVASPSGPGGGEFDDLVTWGSLPILFSRLVSVGKLP